MQRPCAVIVAVLVGLSTSALAQTDLIKADPDAASARSDSSRRATVSSDGWTNAVTVVTMAPDGAWGVATAMSTNFALPRAIANCRRMSGAELGCGASMIASRGGWIVAVRCDNDNILAADPSLAEAKRSAVEIEADIRLRYRPDLPPCAQVLTVDPHGMVVVPSDLVQSLR
jgi:hypothetical protein